MGVAVAASCSCVAFDVAAEGVVGEGVATADVVSSARRPVPAPLDRLEGAGPDRPDRADPADDARTLR